MIGIFAGFTSWSSSEYVSTIGTLIGSELVDIVAWDALLIWAFCLFTYLGFSWTISLTVTLRGISGGLALMNISARVLNASL